MDLPSRVNHQKLLQVLGINIPDQYPASLKCPVCNTYNSLHAHRLNATSSGYFCSSCGFIGDGIQLFKSAGDYLDLDTACTDMMAIPELLNGNLTEVRASLINYIHGNGLDREIWANTLNEGWNRLNNDCGDAANTIWELGLQSGPDVGSRLIPEFCILTKSELEDVFRIDPRFLRRYRNARRRFLCMPLFLDILTITGFLIFQPGEKDVLEVSISGRDVLPGTGGYLTWSEPQKTAYIFDDPITMSLFNMKFKADFSNRYCMLYNNTRTQQPLASNKIILASDFTKTLELMNNFPGSLGYVADSFFVEDMDTLLSNDLEKLVKSKSKTFNKHLLDFVEDATDIEILEAVNNLRLTNDDIQRLINESPVEQKYRLETLLTETKDYLEIPVFDKIIVLKDGNWLHNGVLVSNAPFVIDSVIHNEKIGSTAKGTITFNNNVYNFSSPLQSITRDPIGWLQTQLIKEGAGVPQINRKYKSILYDIAISQQPPEATSTEVSLGWDLDSKLDKFVLPKFSLDYNGMHPHPTLNCINPNANIDIPDELRDSEKDDLLDITETNKQFWNTIGYLLYDLAATKFGYQRYHLCFVTEDYKDTKIFLDSIKSCLGSADLDFSKSNKNHLARQTLLASDTTLPNIVDYEASYRMPGLLAWLKDSTTPIITSMKRIDFYNMPEGLPWLYINVPSNISDSRYYSLFRYLWLRILEILQFSKYPETDRDIRHTIQDWAANSMFELSGKSGIKGPRELIVSLSEDNSVKVRSMSNLERFVATCMAWSQNGTVEVVNYLDNEMPSKTDVDKIVYTNGQYLFPRDYLIPLFSREGFLPPQTSLIEKDLKKCSNEDYSFKLHARHWWRVPFVEVAYHRESY